MTPTKQLTGLVQSLTIRQRWTIAVVVVLIAVGVLAFSQFERNAGFRPLYNGLSPEDAAAVLQKLKESGTPYRLMNNGATISVPEEKVAELRLEMAGAGLPKNGRIGFELFDKTNFGMTEFTEHVNYRRALEGELERSVMSVAAIEQARVHISLPQESVFLDSRQPAKASVLIKIRQGAVLPDSAIPAITNLISSAVEGLAADNVSVLDMRGNLLNRAKRIGPAMDDSSDALLEYRQKVEQDLSAKLSSTLEALVGAGHFRTAVSAECDMNSGEQSEETFDPTNSVMVTSQKTEDVSNQNRVAAGVPGTASTLPDPGEHLTAPGSSTSRKTENISYQTSHTVKRTVVPQGAIRRLSISVLLDHEVHMEANGTKRVLVAPAPERIKAIHDLVAAASGLNPERGDQLIVESLPFETTLDLDAPAGPEPVKAAPKQATPLEQLQKNPKILIGAVACGLLVTGGGIFTWIKLRRSKAKTTMKVSEALPAAEQKTKENTYPQQIDTTPAEPPPAALSPGRVEVLATQIRSTAQRTPEICAGVLRGWLREERI